jgi:hypothetical protein
VELDERELQYLIGSLQSHLNASTAALKKVDQYKHKELKQLMESAKEYGDTLLQKLIAERKERGNEKIPLT